MLFLGEDFPDPGENVDPDTVGQVRGAVTQLWEGGQVRYSLCKREKERGLSKILFWNIAGKKFSIQIQCIVGY